MDESPAGRTVKKLLDNQELRREGLSLVVGHLLTMPLVDLIPPAELVGWLHDGFDEPWPREHVEKLLNDLRADLFSRDVRIGKGVPEALRPEIEELLQKASDPPEWVGSLIDGERVKRLFEPVIQSSLLAFAKRMPGAGIASGGVADKLRQRALKSAGKVRELGRLAAQGIGAELDKRVQATVADFSSGLADDLRGQIRERLDSPEGRQLAAEIRIEAFRRALRLEAAPLVEELLKQDPAWWDIARKISVAVDSEGLRERSAAHLASFVGQTTLTDWLGGRAEATRTLLIERTDALAVQVFGDAKFEDWLGRVLAE